MVRVLLFYAIALVLSWTTWLPLWAPGLGLPSLPPTIQQPLGAFGPLLAALVMIGTEGGAPGLRRFFGRFIVLPTRAWLVPVAALVPFAVALVAAAIAGIWQPAAFDGLFRSGQYPTLSPIVLLALYVVAFGLGEEPGWRGYALGRLEQRMSPFLASVIVGLGWAVWHLPLLFFWPGFQEMGIGGAAGWFVSLMLGAMILTLLHDLGDGALLPPILFHGAVNTALAYDGPADLVPTIAGALMTALGVSAGVRLWRSSRPRNLREPR